MFKNAPQALRRKEIEMSNGTEITIKTGRHRICGYVGDREVMSMMVIFGDWMIGSSSCLPTDVALARLYVECMRQVLDAAAKA